MRIIRRIRKVFVFSILLAIVITLCGWSWPDPKISFNIPFFGDDDNSTFNVQFIDVGQGDAALVECDGHYMLIDGGDVQAGDKVYRTLEEKGIQKLDILVMSHLHEDHIGGLRKALTYASSIGLTLSNSDESDTECFHKVKNELDINGAKITIPRVGEKFPLGSAEVEVVDVDSTNPNDSLVLLLTYGNTRFLFTGDIEYNPQKRIAEKYENESDGKFKIDLIKMPHHGSRENSDLIRFINAINPVYAVISVGAGNKYNHPDDEVLELLGQANVKVYRTDLNGDITVKSDGKSLSFETSK